LIFDMAPSSASREPLMNAAYSDDYNSGTMLKFPPWTWRQGCENRFPNLRAGSSQNRNDTVLKLVLSNLGQAGWRAMK
jgi:hypothetical protein